MSTAMIWEVPNLEFPLPPELLSKRLVEGFVATKTGGNLLERAVGIEVMSHN